MTTSLRTLHALTVAAALCVSLAAVAQTPPAAPVPAPIPISPPADAPAPKPADVPVIKPAAKPVAKSAAKPAPKKTEAKKAGEVSFGGTVAEADKVNFTLTLTPARVLLVTSQTRFFKGGKPAVFDDAAVGEEVSGQYQKGADGQWEALTIHIGTKRPAPAGGKKTGQKPAEKKPFTE